MTYTKEQRLEIYKKALDLFHNPGDYLVNYLCNALSIVIPLPFYSDFDFMEKSLPELYALKPFGKKMGDVWWGDEDREFRIKILEEIISKMEKELVK